MNKTKKLTQGAMLLAIFGALILIDRITSFLFTELVVLIAPIIIILYAAMQDFKDSVFLAIGVVIITFLLGSMSYIYLIYVPVGIFTGLAYAFFLKRNFNQKTLLFVSILTYVFGELIANYFIYPILGFPVSQMIEEFKLALSQAGEITNQDYGEAFKTLGFDLDNIIVVIYMISVILTGVMEGIIIHILALFLFKRFKICDIGKLELFSNKPNKYVAYIAFLSVFSIFFRKYIESEALSNILLVLSLTGSILLLYYGYIFLVLYGRFVLKKNIAFLVILLAFIFPVILYALICVGFLYAAGPLHNYLHDNILKHE